MKKKENYKGQINRISYQRGYKDALTDAITLLEMMKYVPNSKELSIFTVNPIILELKALRGDFREQGI